MTDTTELRAAFEKWAHELGPSHPTLFPEFVGRDGEYAHADTHAAWLGFQAGHASARNVPETPKEDLAQNWAGMDGATAFHLIERHADGWGDVGYMMEQWRAANASATQQHEGLRKAAQEVMECIQIQHRPPVRDELERGRMVLVRLHALADLHDALHHHGTASTGAASSPISTDSTPTVDAALSVAGERETCQCEACRPVTMADPDSMRMILCATCGNKRCPHATDHRNACTNSNESGQPGSSWEHIHPAPALGGGDET